MKDVFITGLFCFVSTWIVTHIVKDSYFNSVLGNFCYFFWGLAHQYLAQKHNKLN